MTKGEFDALDVGDVIRHRTDIYGYVVMANYGFHVVAVRTVDAWNQEEWDLVCKVKDRKFADASSPVVAEREAGGE